MQDRHEQASDFDGDPIDRRRRRLLVALAAGTGAAALGTLVGTRGADADAVASSGTSMVRIVFFDDRGKRLGNRLVPKIVKSAAAWKKQLSPLAYRVTRERGTERAFSGDYSKPAMPGIYRCVCCDTALYDAATQFHSGTGWPSFWQPIASENVREITDSRLFMRRTEIKCARCAGHLGHVFQDGPPPTGLRYCMNSAALHFVATSAA